MDPPFNSKATYNVLFKEPTGEQSKAQVEAFEDTWHWTEETEKAFQEIVDTAPSDVVNLMNALKDAIHKNDMMAYLTMMCIRLLELKRVLKDTGSIYLHCDPTASHYLKIVMDAIFGVENFRNEVIWQKTLSRKAQSHKFGKIHDVILFYSKGSNPTFVSQYEERDEETIKRRFPYVDEKTGKRYVLDNFTQAGQGPPRRFGDKLLAPPQGKHWIWTQEKIEEGLKKGLIRFTKNGMPRLVRYETEGIFAGDILADKKFMLHSQSKKKVGYPTQKPEALLERIIKASSNEGDTVLDPFCGCGTALVAAHRLNRKWIGIDITHLAISLMKWRLKSNFPDIAFEVIGEPMDLSGAKALSDQNKYQFQWWALSLIDARPYGDKKKGADMGIDGYYYFNDGGKTKKAIVSVKGGHVTVSQIRELIHVVEREEASMGFFITLNNPTGPMKEEATKKGFYKDSFGNEYPKVQILTIEDILNGKKPDTPQKVPIYESTTKGKEITKGEQKRLS